MAFEDEIFRTGRKGTFVASLFLAVGLFWLAIANITGISTSLSMTVLEAVVLIGTSIFLFVEIFYEGKRRGLERDYSFSEVVGSVFSMGLFVIGVTGLVSGLLDSVPVLIPLDVKTAIFLVSSFFLTEELVTE